MRDIAERDWKVLRRLAPIALDRHCAQTLQMVQAVIDAGDATNHEKFLKLFTLIHERNREVARAFDNLRRSDASLHLMTMLSLGLLNEDELREFSDELQAHIKTW